MMILIIGFTCPPSIDPHFKLAIESTTSVITKCDIFFYYKVRQFFLQSATIKCETEQTPGKIVL